MAPHLLLTSVVWLTCIPAIAFSWPGSSFGVADAWPKLLEPVSAADCVNQVAMLMQGIGITANPTMILTGALFASPGIVFAVYLCRFHRQGPAPSGVGSHV